MNKWLIFDASKGKTTIDGINKAENNSEDDDTSNANCLKEECWWQDIEYVMFLNPGSLN